MSLASPAVRGRVPAAIDARLFGAVEVLAFVTVGELVKWSEPHSWGQRQRGALDAWPGQRPVIDSTDEVSRTWGWLAASTQTRGVPVSGPGGTAENEPRDRIPGRCGRHPD